MLPYHHTASFTYIPLLGCAVRVWACGVGTTRSPGQFRDPHEPVRKPRDEIIIEELARQAGVRRPGPYTATLPSRQAREVLRDPSLLGMRVEGPPQCCDLGSFRFSVVCCSLLEASLFTLQT